MTADSDGDLHVLVLAAGRSLRFGSAKQAAQVGGQALLQVVASRATALAGHAVTIVLGARAGELTPLLRNSPASIVVNRDFAEGIASSIRAGLARVPAQMAGALTYLEPVAAAVAGAAVFGEHLGLASGAGAIAIVTGGIWVATESRCAGR